MEKRISPAGQLPVPVELVARRIYIIRGQRVMLDSDLAELYQVTTKRLNEAVRRNSERFPEDFMFQVTEGDLESLRSQFATSNEGRGGRRYLPYAFTEHGVAMLSSVLRSERAVQMSILIVRAFVKLREVLATNRALAQRIESLTATQRDHAALFDIVIKDIQSLDKKLTGEIRKLKAPRRRKARIGFHVPGDK
jgi:phage regulator Rha-like protein